MINKVETIDYTKYDMLWLGGDLTKFTSAKDSVLIYVDKYLDLKNKNTLWALGNHDYSDLELIEQFTDRPAYYAYYKNGITFLVLDTQDSLSNFIDNQLNLIKSVTDTINQSSHLVVLHHKLIWMYNNEHLASIAPDISNGLFGNSCFPLHKS